MTTMEKVYRFFGGRKMFLGFFGIVVLSLGVWKIPGATYDTWAMYVATILGVAKGTMAWEDRGKHMSTFVEDDAP